MLAAFAFVVAAIAFSAPVAAQTGPPWDGNPVSPGLGPTYGEEWCAPVGSENVPQGEPLAILPYGAIRCTLEQFETEAAAAGVPDRLDVSVIGQSELGRDMFGVVVNALETPEQQSAYARWQRFGTHADRPGRGRGPAGLVGERQAAHLRGGQHRGGEREGTDAMMQVIRTW